MEQPIPDQLGILYDFDSYVDECDSEPETESTITTISSKKTIDLRRDILSAFENMNQIIIDMKESLQQQH